METTWLSSYSNKKSVNISYPLYNNESYSNDVSWAALTFSTKGKQSDIRLIYKDIQYYYELDDSHDESNKDCRYDFAKLFTIQTNFTHAKFQSHRVGMIYDGE